MFYKKQTIMNNGKNHRNLFLLKILCYMAIVVCGLFVFCYSAIANEIMTIRSTNDNNLVYVFFDMKAKPKFTEEFSNNKTEYKLTFYNIDNPSKKLNKVEIKSKGAIKKLQRITNSKGKKTLSYVFTVAPYAEPKTELKGNSNQGYYLQVALKNTEHQIISLGNNSSNSKNTSNTNVNNVANNNNKKNDGSNADDKEDIKYINNSTELEKALLADINSAGDGEYNATPSARNQIVAPQVSTKKVQKTSRPLIVVVDPGHGGKDPGAMKNNVYEKKVTLAVSKYLVGYIEADPQMKGYLTRSRDVFIELGKRSEIARDKNADVLISIHADSAENATAHGASILVLNASRAKRENSRVENSKEKHGELLGGVCNVFSDSTQKNSYVTSMIIDMASESARDLGNKLAKNILNTLKRSVSLHNSKPILRSLAVLKAPDIPSLLIETGYISNAEEAKLLNTQKYQKMLAYSIYLGIKNFVKENPTILHENTCENSSGTYTVKPGDSLLKIANKHGMTLSGIKKLNNLKKDTITPGQVLKVSSK